MGKANAVKITLTVLLLAGALPRVHDNDSNNMMCAAAMCTGKPAYLNDKQLKAIRACRFLIKL